MTVVSAIQTISAWAIPVILLAVPLYAYTKGVPVYEAFCAGAKEGFTTALRILPFLVAMFVGLAVFRESRALAHILGFIQPAADVFGFPGEVLPLAFIRPLSGSGALAVLANILEEHGADTLVGLMASTMQGSTETTFYVLTVYLGAVGVTKARHITVVSLIADGVGFIVAAAVTQWVFFR